MHTSKRTVKTKILSLLLVAVLVLGCVSTTTTYAAGDGDDSSAISASEEEEYVENVEVVTGTETVEIEIASDEGTESEDDIFYYKEETEEIPEDEGISEGDENPEAEENFEIEELSEGEESSEGEGEPEEELPEEMEDLPEDDEEIDEFGIMTLADSQESELNSDDAYVSNVSFESGSGVSSFNIVTGTAEWDSDDNAGNDSSADNNILRTFDTVTYSVDIATNTRSGNTYEKGNLYFEFVVKGSSSEVQWETGSMGWLESKHGVYAETTEQYNGNDYQVLRGYITLEPSTVGGHAIGNATQSLSIVLRALAMQNGDKLTSQFTFFLDYNDVGLSDDQYKAWGTSSYSGPAVTFNGSECKVTGHSTEYETLMAPDITISAAPSYNLAIVNSTASKTQQMGSYDFSTGNDKALNKEDNLTKYGRLGGYGLVLQIVGKNASSGLKGVELPKDGETLTVSFDLTVSSTYTSGTTVYETGTVNDDEGNADLTEYAPLVWSFDENKTGSSQQDERSIPVSTKYADQVPYNKLSNNTGYNYASCYDGGTWNIEVNSNGTYTVTITGCEVDMSQLPYIHPGAGTSLSYNYYNPNNINYDINDDSKNDYWEVQTACLSAGELWIIQPYYLGERDDGETYIAQMLGEGTYKVTASDTSLKVVSESDQSVLFEQTDEKSQSKTTDDSADQSMALVNPGSIDQHIAYVKYNYAAYNDPLTDGCFQSAKDWILQGDKLTIETYVTNDQAEEGNTGVAYDVMIKFDDAFFEPDGTITLSGQLNGETRTALWAAKPDKSGWSHTDGTGNKLSPDENGYDSEMINATPDDLIYFSSLKELEDAGYTCVGVLVQYRGLMTEQQNHIHTYVKGTSKTTAEADQVYMVTPYCRSWDRDDLATAMAEDSASEYYGKKSEALSALMGMSLTDINNVVKDYIPTKEGDGDNKLKYEDDNKEAKDYPSAHWINGDIRYLDEDSGGSSRTKTILNYVKCSYDDDGCHEGTSGNYWGDSCLLVGYKSGLTMKVAQSTTAGDGSTHEKSVFDMDTAQTVVDYEISPYLELNNGEGISETTTSTTVVVTVDIPENLTYINGSSYIGGTYTTVGEGKQGTVSDGVNLTENQESSVTYIVDGKSYTVDVTLTVETEPDGTQKLVYTFTNVPVIGDESGLQYLDNIFFSCDISSGAVSGGDELDVTADISCTADAGIEPTMRDNGEAIVGITVSKNTAISLIKTADQTAVEVDGEIGFTIDIGDNSNNSMTMLAVDNIPYNGDGNSKFANSDCNVYVTEFSAYDVTSSRDLSNFYFFYTTNKEYADKTSADYEVDYFVTDLGENDNSDNTKASVNQKCIYDGWVLMNMKDEGKDSAGHEFYDFTDFPEKQQVYAIVGIGVIEGNDDINMHVTLKLSDAEPGDIVVNTVSQQHATTSTDEDGETITTYFDLSDNASTRVVGRTISGTVWLDEDMDGSIQTGIYNEEQLLDGVDVELQIKDENDSWVTAMNLKTGDESKTKTSGKGYYEFDYVPAGEFRVVFSGTGTPANKYGISPYYLDEGYVLSEHIVTALKANGIDEEHNSNVKRDDTNTDVISDISMPEATAISGDTYDVVYQNAGYTKKQELDVSKIWVAPDGTEVAEGNGTTEITATVVTSQGTWTVKLNEDNKWADKIDNLWYYDGNGNPVVYALNSNITVTESGQSSKYELKDIQLTGNKDEGFAVVLENDEVTTEIDVEKVWEGDEDYEEYRPEITVNLLADGEETGEELTLKADNGWKGSFTNLSVYNDDGLSEIEYSVEEVSVDDYNTEITKNTVTNEDGTTTVSFTITNTMIEPKMTKSVAEDDYERKEESGVDMHDGEDTNGGGWGTWDDADNNQEVTYQLTLTELSNVRNLVVHDYLQDGLDFEPETVEITLYTYDEGNKLIEKTLVEYEDYTVSQGTCSDPACTMDGCTFEVKFTDDDDHKPFADLPDGSYMVITYKALTETHEADYEDYEDDLVNSSYMTYGASTAFLRRSAVVYAETDLFGFGIYKYADEFGEGVALAGAEFVLERDGMYARFEVETDEESGEDYYMITGWVSINESDESDADIESDDDSGDDAIGNVILVSGKDGMIRIEGLDDDTYTITEISAPAGYKIVNETITVIIDENGNVTVDGNTGSKDAVTGHVVNVENTLILTEVEGSKTWDDNDNQDGMRPESITIRLLADGVEVDSVTVTEAEGWSWSFTDLWMYQDGVKIDYTIVEDAIDDYSAVYDGYDVINTHTPGQTSVTVVKVWDDSDDQDGIRPESITVKLLVNGEDSGLELILSDEDGWIGSFTELDVYTDGVENVYTVEEIEVEGYTTEITGDASAGFIVTNTHTPEEPDLPEATDDNTPGITDTDNTPGGDEETPAGNSSSTGDSSPLMLYIMLLAISTVMIAGIGCIMAVNSRKKRGQRR